MIATIRKNGQIFNGRVTETGTYGNIFDLLGQDIAVLPHLSSVEVWGECLFIWEE